jgi:S1-C subfamily serine protease
VIELSTENENKPSESNGGENSPPNASTPESMPPETESPRSSEPTPRINVDKVPRRESRNWVTAILGVLLVLSLGFSTFVYFDSSSRIGKLTGEISTLTSSVQTLSASLAESNSKLNTLSEKVGMINVSDDSSGSDVSVTAIYERVKDSVVLITSSLPQGTATGSGFIFDTEGRIVTNYHVINGANNIRVTFINGTIVKATVVGTDPYSDIAVIDVDAPIALLVPLKLGSSSALQVGESVLAIGNPYGLADTLTTGIISALGREMDSESGYPIVDVIQTDAAINPGNSGGPLLNMKGEVVGINTAIPSSTSTGIGFAVPSDTITREINSLITTGTYAQIYIGIQGVDVTPTIISAMNLPEGTYGTVVTTVTRWSPADKAGLKGGTNYKIIDGSYVAIGGDVIIAADGKKITSLYNLILYMQRNKRPGDVMTLTVLRNGLTTTVEVTLGTRTG